MFKTVNINRVPLQIKQAWEALQRTIQTDVEHTRVINGEASALTLGDVVYISAVGTNGLSTPTPTARLARADAAATAYAVAVVSDVIPAGATGVVRLSGHAWVKFEAGLGVLTNGSQAFLSVTDSGKATDTAPSVGGQYVASLGVVDDGSPYDAGAGGAYVLLNKCCAAPRA